MNVTASMFLEAAPGRTFKELMKYFHGVDRPTVRKLVDFLIDAGQLELLPTDRYALTAKQAAKKGNGGETVPKIPSVGEILSKGATEAGKEDEHTVSLHTAPDPPDPPVPKKKKEKVRPLVIPEQFAVTVEVSDGAAYFYGRPYIVTIIQGPKGDEQDILLTADQWDEIRDYVEKEKVRFID